jgi:hypothetical protein
VECGSLFTLTEVKGMPLVFDGSPVAEGLVVVSLSAATPASAAHTIRAPHSETQAKWRRKS